MKELSVISEKINDEISKAVDNGMVFFIIDSSAYLTTLEYHEEVRLCVDPNELEFMLSNCYIIDGYESGGGKSFGTQR